MTVKLTPPTSSLGSFTFVTQIVIVDVPEPGAGMGFGLKPTLMPSATSYAARVAVKVTGALKPPIRVVDSGYVVHAPEYTLIWLCWAESVKPGTVTVTVAVGDGVTPLAVPVIVIV